MSKRVFQKYKKILTLQLKEIRDSSKKYLTEILKAMKEKETIKKYYTELLQLEFEAEINNSRSEKIPIEKKIKEFLDKCSISKYKTPNKPLKNNTISNEENNFTVEVIKPTSRHRTVETIPMKDITNNQINRNKIVHQINRKSSNVIFKFFYVLKIKNFFYKLN